MLQYKHSPHYHYLEIKKRMVNRRKLKILDFSELKQTNLLKRKKKTNKEGCLEVNQLRALVVYLEVRNLSNLLLRLLTIFLTKLQLGEFSQDSLLQYLIVLGQDHYLNLKEASVMEAHRCLGHLRRRQLLKNQKMKRVMMSQCRQKITLTQLNQQETTMVTLNQRCYSKSSAANTGREANRLYRT